jgi:hypothetical protein
VSAMRVRAVAVAALLGAAACVEITTAEGGVQSIALNALPPSIVAGDLLRDTLGAELRLRAVAFGETGDTVTSAVFTYGFLPIGADTGAARTALTVDSATGRARAALLPGVAQVRVTARYGARLQIVDTLAIVRPPRRLARVNDADTVFTVRYLCTDSSRELRSDSVFATASRTLTVKLTGDSLSDTTIAVPNYLVQYRIVDTPAVRRGISPYRDERPVWYVTHPRQDRPIGFDTTTATGTTSAQLRVIPYLMRPTDTSTTVEARAFLRDSVVSRPVRFRVRFVRQVPASGTPCP